MERAVPPGELLFSIVVARIFFADFRWYAQERPASPAPRMTTSLRLNFYFRKPAADVESEY